MEKKALGRGLDALLPATKPASVSELSDVQHLRIEAIVPNRYQPRQTFDPQELMELTASLKQSGLLQPILVRRKGDGIYELISGERRWRAAKEAGSETIQAVIRNCGDEESIVLALVENLQRTDLNPMEMA
ncbi:MAG: ParB/RepB/Spo0J family partition protein, partial [Nitrospirota bacterium]